MEDRGAAGRCAYVVGDGNCVAFYVTHTCCLEVSAPNHERRKFQINHSMMTIRLMEFGNIGGCGPGPTDRMWPSMLILTSPCTLVAPGLFQSEVDFQVQTEIEPHGGILAIGGTEPGHKRLTGYTLTLRLTLLSSNPSLVDEETRWKRVLRQVWALATC